MLGTGKMALMLLAGGPLLGALLAAAANPVMKAPPEQPWRAGLQAPYDAEPAYPAEAAQLGWQDYPDSYAPPWLGEEITDWEPDYPAWAYSEFSEIPTPQAAEQAPPPVIEVPPLTPLNDAQPAAEAAPVSAPPDGLAPIY